ncbi:hypothetical protein EBBID32_18320 [Sphingobium indicum BiD32]|uniref:Uncharacterized protein n=1 Tax=Sphingobium indicum BiD32 TaxID=1301087 RepID=N1MKL7_9SPHN|nr:hypothetical protein EBBID32_18320 [Sphingobium indicum BiD32]
MSARLFAVSRNSLMNEIARAGVVFLDIGSDAFKVAHGP